MQFSVMLTIGFPGRARRESTPARTAPYTSLERFGPFESLNNHNT